MFLLTFSDVLGFFLNLSIGIIFYNVNQYSVTHIFCHCICATVALIEYIGCLVHVFILAVSF